MFPRGRVVVKNALAILAEPPLARGRIGTDDELRDAKGTGSKTIGDGSR
jgi:hypothetical protein